jgi:hypothetical protein
LKKALFKIYIFLNSAENFIAAEMEIHRTWSPSGVTHFLSASAVSMTLRSATNTFSWRFGKS